MRTLWHTPQQQGQSSGLSKDKFVSLVFSLKKNRDLFQTSSCLYRAQTRPVFFISKHPVLELSQNIKQLSGNKIYLVSARLFAGRFFRRKSHVINRFCEAVARSKARVGCCMQKIIDRVNPTPTTSPAGAMLTIWFA
jgi:hypothetical protein